MSYATIDIQGGLFSSDLIERIGEGGADIKGQRPADFGLRRGRRLPDEIQRAFSDSRVYWDAFDRRLKRSKESRTTLTRQDWAAKFFELLGFPALQYQRAGPSSPSHRINGGEAATPIHIVALGQGLDDRAARNRRSPHTQVQDFLNRSEALWGVATNGAHLRLLRDTARLSKPTYLEFDLQAMIEGNAYSEFVVLYRLMHSTRFPLGETPPHECLLENYYNQGIEDGGRVREKLRHGVRAALEVLGSALVSHPGNEALRRAVRSGGLDQAGYYRQLLNFVYRMLFLMVAEERKLLFLERSTGQHVYNRHYSVARLRDRAELYFAGDDHTDLWTGLAQTFRLCRDEDAARHLNLAPPNGELFGEQACRDIETAFCSNESLLTAMLHLSTFDDGGIRRRVNYAQLDVEEFGSVYESLLDYRPVLDLGEASGRPSFDLAAGTQRKETGSYYTPPELVHELVKSALVPVMEERLAAAETRQEKIQALLGLRVCDPASGSGHFLLAAARRIARELAKLQAGEEEPTLLNYRRALRTVVRHCIYAVDKNPLAVDLCKVALWIECHDPGRPLSFLDHHVKCGDSLVGVLDLDVLTEGIPDDAYKAIIGDDKKTASSYRKRNKKERTGQLRLTPPPPAASMDTAKLAEEHEAFGEMEEQTASEVKAMEELYGDMRGQDTSWWRLKTACDLWTYAFFAPLQTTGPDKPDLAPTTDDIRNVLKKGNLGTQLETDALQASRDHPYFHWPLEFPDVFKNGGFDIVLGNPPWERIKLQEKEFFAGRDPEIANAPNKAARAQLIRALEVNNPTLAHKFTRAQHDAKSVSNFVRGSERFNLTGRGDINTYSIFAETARRLLAPIGRLGIIVPTGIATDYTTKLFFSDLIDTKSLVSLFDFQNRKRIFPGITSLIRFCLITISGMDQRSLNAEFGFFLHSMEDLQNRERRFGLSAEDFALFNPNTRTCPIFRTRKDMEIARKMYLHAGVLWKEAKGDEPEINPWSVTLKSMFHMANDSNLFYTYAELVNQGGQLEGNSFILGEERYLPLYESKLFHQYDHRFATFVDATFKDLRKGRTRYMTSEEKTNPNALPLPRYWVSENEVLERTDQTQTTYNSRLQDYKTTRLQDYKTTRLQDSEGRKVGRSEGRKVGRSEGRKVGRSEGRKVSNRPPNHRQSNRSKNPQQHNPPNLRTRKGIGNSIPRWRIALRLITTSTNERTIIATMLPVIGLGHKGAIVTLREGLCLSERQPTPRTNEHVS